MINPGVELDSRQSKTDLKQEPTDQYISAFAWNKVRYRADKPVGELVDVLQKVGDSAM